MCRTLTAPPEDTRGHPTHLKLGKHNRPVWGGVTQQDTWGHRLEGVGVISWDGDLIIWGHLWDTYMVTWGEVQTDR